MHQNIDILLSPDHDHHSINLHVPNKNLRGHQGVLNLNPRIIPQHGERVKGVSAIESRPKLGNPGSNSIFL